jgi:ribonucleotide reductase alpha subunit
MKILKRDGNYESLSFDKVLHRLKKLCNDISLGKLETIDSDLIAQKTVSSIYDGISSSELDEEAARISIGLIENREYAQLASRIIISNIQKNTSNNFHHVMEILYNNVDLSNKHAPIITKEMVDIVRKHKDIINSTIQYSRDYLFDYFGYKTLEKSYLLRLNNKVVERPQHLYMRVALQLHKEDIENVVKTYNLISQHYFTFASPTIFNSGCHLNGLSSCYLIGSSDSIEGIFKTATDCAKISKVGGGIGLHISNIRAKGSRIRGTNGTSDGIIPMLKVFNEVSVYVNQCILPDVNVYTKNGLKRMDQVTTSDFLITHDGSFKKVNDVFINNKSEMIYKFYTKYSIDALKCTKDHDICTLSFQSGQVFIEYAKADTLKLGNYVGYPIPTHENNLEFWSLEKCRFYGIMLGNYFNISNDTYYTFESHKYSKETLNFIHRFLNKYNITFCEDWSIPITSIDNIGIYKEMVYDENDDKYCHEDILHLPKHKINMFFRGLLEFGDNISSDMIIGSNCHCMNKRFKSKSKNVIRSLRFLLLKYSILTSGGLAPCDTNKNIYYLNLPNMTIDIDTITISNNNETYFEYCDTLWCKITSVEHEFYEGKVYDFNMIDNHNYLTESGLVHNSGRRKGSFAIYLSPEHPDILEFLDLRKNQGNEQLRARDLFLAMWIPDLFMKKVQENGDWYLMCPDECPGLNDVYGDEYDNLYNEYISKGMYRKKIKAQDIWTKILDSQMETGTPYLLYKDSINKKSNQQNIGVIKSSNLCVAPDTMILTSDGFYPIASLKNKAVQVWNGKEFTNTIVKKTGEKVQLIKVILSNGIEIECTPYHHFYTKNNVKLEAHDLTTGTQLIQYDLPIVYTSIVLENAFESGQRMSTMCNEKYYVDDNSEKELNTFINEIIVPVNYDLKSKLSWLNGLFTEGFGFCSQDKNAKVIVLNCKYVTFLQKIMSLLQTLSCQPSIVYHNNVYSLIINNIDINVLESLGLLFKHEYICISDILFKVYSDLYKNVYVTNIIENYKITDTYCFKESKRGMGIFNGILTGQCAEITLYSDDKEYAVCFTGDTQVLTNTGYKRIDQCGDHDTYALSIFNNDVDLKYKPTYISSILIPNGVREVYKLNCYGMNPIKATKNHLFLTCDNADFISDNDKYTWKKLIDLTKSDNLVIVDPENPGLLLKTNLISVEYAGQEKVYDLHVPDAHNFVAEGFVVHNCNLSSVALPKYVEYNIDGKPYFNHQLLFQVAKDMILPMNNVIDYNYYPTSETELSNFKHRPIGIGVQGLADTYIKMRYPFESDQAKKLNKEIFETLYYGALSGSLELAKRDGPYSTFKDSPYSKGKLQFDLWKDADNINLKDYLTGRWDWDTLKKEIQTHGVRNSTLLTCMPTASSAQIMGNSDTMEPIDSCIYKKRVLSGEYIIANKYLVKELTEMGLWCKELKDTIISNNGSIQNISIIPDHIKELYKTVWEMSMKNIIDQSAHRAVYIDMTQSLNLFMQNPNYKKLTSMHFYAWNKKLKTGIYYLRQKVITGGKFSVDPELEKKLRELKTNDTTKQSEPGLSSTEPEDEAGCEMCSA